MIHLVQLVNGVKLFEVVNSGDTFEDVLFHFIYEEQEYFNRPIVVDLLQVNVIYHGPMWMFVIRDVSYEDYITNRSIFALAIGEIHNRIMPYLKEKYGFNIEQHVLADHEDCIYDTLTHFYH